MSDHIEQAALLIAHPKMTRPAKLHPDCPVCQNATATVRQLADAGLLADPAPHAERLDRALWLWAEAQWHLEGAANGWTEQYKRADALQARIDAVLVLLAETDELTSGWPLVLEEWASMNSRLIRMRTLLKGDQPEVPGG